MSGWNPESFQRFVSEDHSSRRCILTLRDLGRRFSAWWRETTDIVVLSSCYLHRETGHAFRSVVLCVVAAMWFPVFLDRDFKQIGAQRFAVWIILIASSISSLVSAVSRQRERVRTGLVYTVVMAWSLNELMAGPTRYLHVYPENRLVYVTVALCHSNVHPLPLVLAICLLRVCSLIDYFYLHFYFVRPCVQIYAVTTTFFEFLLFAAFTRDFTNRVKVVSSGMIFCEDPVDSPLMGRSARALCWLMAINSCLTWAAHLIVRATCTGSSDQNMLYQNRLPTCTCLAFAGLLLAALAANSKRLSLSAWQADLALAFCCCTPPIMMLMDLMLIEDHTHSRVYIEFITHFNACALLLFFAAVHTLVQAGCKPLLCTGPCILLTLQVVISFLDWMGWLHEDLSAHPWGTSELVLAAPLSWIIWFSHRIDYFKRLAAIQQGVERLRENAESSQSVLITSSICNHPRATVELQHLESHNEAQASPDPAAVAVAVVRHAERADAYHTFNEWGCSEDAEKFPFDPPITNTGVEQVREVAEDLKRQASVEMGERYSTQILIMLGDTKWRSYQVRAVDLVISSPYLRCLQTAELLAQEFDAVVLLDNELGEVLGPEVFDTQPPMPVRSWQSVKKYCHTGRVKAGRAMGKAPRWPESLKEARLRYAKGFLKYLRRARHVKKSCILVTHGHMLQVSASILPATHHLMVNSVDYCAVVLAMCHKIDEATTPTEDGAALGRVHRPTLAMAQRRAASFDSALNMDASTNDAEHGRLMKQNQVIQDVNVKYWSVQLKGLRTNLVEASLPPIFRQLEEQKDQLGISWQDLVRLLGLLPAQCDFFPAPCGSTEAGGSFQTDAHTMSSMNHFRDPRGMKSSPPSEASGGAGLVWAPQAEAALHPAPALQLGRSSLALRRAGSAATMPSSESTTLRLNMGLSSLAKRRVEQSEGADST